MTETVLVLQEFGTGYGLILLAFLVGYVGGVVHRFIRIGEDHYG